MPRWLQITLSLVLFAIVMLALRAVLHAWVPSAIAWLDGYLGEYGSAFLIFGFIAAAGILGIWLTRADAARRSGLPTRR